MCAIDALCENLHQAPSTFTSCTYVVHLHSHPVHLHLSPAQLLQVFTPTPQLLHFAMTCHFFVCDWGARVVRNPVCNCTSWEFRRLRNESKVPDDQTVNRLLAAAQLKSPCAGSHLIRTLFIAEKFLCGIFSSPVI